MNQMMKDLRAGGMPATQFTQPRAVLIRLAFGIALFANVSPESTSAETYTFQNGINGYTGTVDTFIAENDPGTPKGNLVAVEWDDDDPGGTGLNNFALLRFQNLFDSSGGPIPAGDQITSATLTYTIFNVGDEGTLRESQVPWDETTTFNSFGGGGNPGVQPSEYGGLQLTAPASVATQNLNVTSSLAAWSTDPASNRGWIILPTDTNGAEFRSSEYATIALRPKLTVVTNEGEPTAQLVRQPYLQMGTPHSMTVVWRTDIPTTTRLRYGSAPGNLTQTISDATPQVDHIVTITGLDPANKYFYDVGSNSIVLAGGDPEYFFVTPPPAGTRTRFTAWIVGDSGTGDADQAAVRDAMLAETSAQAPDVYLHMGDMAYDNGTESEFSTRFYSVYQSILRNTVCWPTIGNHEGANSDSGTESGPYYEGYVLPRAGEAGGMASGTEAYYSFDHGNAHFVCLDSHDSDRTPPSPMLDWLALDLASTDSDWLIVFFHHPPYTKGSHDSDSFGDSGGRLVEMRENVLPILETAGVDLVLGGHSHIYERSFLIDAAYAYGVAPDFATPVLSTLLANNNIVDGGDGRLAGDGAYLKSTGQNANDGTIYVVAGHGGRGLGQIGTHPVMYFTEREFGSCILSIDGQVLSMRNIRDDGVISDSFHIVKGPRSCDINKDASVNALDVQPFVSILLGQIVDTAMQAAADINADGTADVSDIAPFVECLASE